MGNIATGIGLSGKLEVDNSGQLNRLAAERDAAQARQQEKARKDKERKDLEAEVSKNMLVKSGLNIPFNQRDFSRRAASTMADMIEGIQSGEKSTAEIYGKIQEFNNYAESIRAADKQLFSSLEEIRKNPDMYDWDGERIFGGKPVNSVFEALNDPYSDTPEGMEELGKVFWGNEYAFKKSTPEEIALGMPERMVSFNPRPMADPRAVTDELVKDPNLYTESKFSGVERFDPRTNQLMREHGWGLSDQAIDGAKQVAMNNPSVWRTYEKKYREKFQKENPNGTYEEFKASSWMDQALQDYDNEVVTDLKKRLANRSIKTDNIPTPPSPKESSAKKALSEMTISVASNGRGGAKVTFNKPGTIIKGNVVLPPDATIRTTRDNGKGEEVEGLYKVGRELQLKEATPTEIVFNGLQNAHIKYIADYNENGEDNGKTNEYVVPLTEQSFSALTTMLGSDNADDVIKMIQGASGADQYDFINKWLSKWGKQMPSTPSGSAKTPAAAPASGTINLQDLPVGAKIEVKNGKNYYNGKEIKM
jgi:hypothetical protein